MKKIIVTFITVAAVMAAVMLPLTSQAAYFTLNDTALLMLWDVYETPQTILGSLSYVGTNQTAYGSASPMLGDVGFMGILDAVPPPNYALMGIGANAAGSSATGSGATTAQVIGAALGTAPSSDLSAFTSYELQLFNDNNSDWEGSLFLETGTSGLVTSSMVTILPGSSVNLALDLTCISGLTNVISIGFQVGGNMPSINPADPSDPDIFHVSASPVPEPSSIFLLFLGFFGLAVVGKKKFL